MRTEPKLKTEFKVHVADGVVEFPDGARYSLESVARVFKWAMKARKKHLAGKSYLEGLHFDLENAAKVQNEVVAGECT